MIRIMHNCLLALAGLSFYTASATEQSEDNQSYSAAAFTELRTTNDDINYFVEGQIEYGSSNSVWGVVVEGSGDLAGEFGDAESKVYFSQDISKSIGYSVGARLDLSDHEFSEYLLGGVHVSLPLYSSFDAIYFLSDEGFSSSRLIFSNSLELTLKWRLDTSLEYNISLHDDESGMGGVTDGEIASRLIYDAKRNYSVHFGYLKEFELAHRRRLISDWGEQSDWLVIGLSGRF